MNFDEYAPGSFFDEMFNERGQPRPDALPLVHHFNGLEVGELERRREAIDRSLMQMGITFTVYGDEQGTEKIFPFDLVPRIVGATEWSHIEAGLKQRIRALNMFISDIYGPQEVLKAGIVPEELLKSAKSYREICCKIRPPKGIWCHITGTDLVRHSDGAYYVLEDNLRCPSGVSYVLQNRLAMKRSFPQLFAECGVRTVIDYPVRLYSTLRHLAPAGVERPTIVVLTPGIYNSAYYEHAFLAQQMGLELVEGRDLVVRDEVVYMRTTRGLEKVDVIYRRIDDDFLDPEVFRADSLLGVPGLMGAYIAGNVGMVNAPGTGIADDKVIYAYVPAMIRHYLDEEPILPNVPTFICARDEDRIHVLANLDKMVVKAANEAGGYGMLVGPHATDAQRAEFAVKIKENPRNYIAQPTLELSRVPTMTEEGIQGRHVDLRPYVLYGEEIWVLPGGLTRVALKKGSLVVNSSQGGGSKDTWVLARIPSEAATSEVML